MSGHLRIETDDGNLEVSFRDLERFPDCLFAICTANYTESEEISIKYERDYEYLSVILKYVGDESGEELKKILSSSEEFLLAILEDAEYLMFKDLSRACRGALEDLGSQFQFIETIQTVHAFKATCKAARKAEVGAVFFNLHLPGDQEKIYTVLRLLDRKRFLVFALYFHAESNVGLEILLKSCKFAVLRPGSKLIHLIDRMDSCQMAQIIWQLHSNSRLIPSSIIDISSGQRERPTLDRPHRTIHMNQLPWYPFLNFTTKQLVAIVVATPVVVYALWAFYHYLPWSLFMAIIGGMICWSCKNPKE